MHRATGIASLEEVQASRDDIIPSDQEMSKKKDAYSKSFYPEGEQRVQKNVLAIKNTESDAEDRAQAKSNKGDDQIQAEEGPPE